jgi:predicted molibdopterin-dependent oxidoreductase YjgC
MMFTIFSKFAMIDEKKVKIRKGMTILEAAKKEGIEIPTLCHIEGQLPTGVCRVCVVEVEGARTLVGSCHTPITEGMVIRTNTPKVLSVRRGVVELMLAAHTGDCVNDPNADSCKLHNLASDQEAGAPRFAIETPRFYPAEETNPYIRRDLSKCILCRKCIIACHEIAGKNVMSIGYRGFDSKVIAGYDEPLTADECQDCGICIEHCPTGALSEAKDVSYSRNSRNARGRYKKRQGRSETLPLLKKVLDECGSLFPEAMERVAKKTNLSLSETFGISSFYSYLPRKGNGANRIRICQCVPCALKEGESVAETLKKELGIDPGEITPDGKFSLELVSCIGACDQAPAMLINDKLFTDLRPDMIADILKEY